MRSLFKFLNFIALIVLLLSCAAAFVEPQKAWQLSFLGFAFPVVLVINFLFLLLWILKRDAFGLLPLFALLLSWSFVESTFALHFREKQTEAGFKLMTWNVKNFDLYNWNRNELTREQMMSLIKEQKPDVLCLQEFYTNNQLFKNVEYIRDTLGYKFVYFSPAVDLKKTPKNKVQKTLWQSGELHQQWGVAIFSKYPVIDSGTIDFENSLTNECIYTDIDFAGKPIRLYNVHFQSIHLGYDDYATLDSLKENQTATWKSLKSILRKMKQAYTKRAQQAVAVSEHMTEHQGEKILCGDFNDVPVSYTYKTAAASLKDAFVEKSFGFGTTYASPLSIFRIDYTLFDERLRINSYKTIRKELSDHYPVCVTFSVGED